MTSSLLGLVPNNGHNQPTGAPAEVHAQALINTGREFYGRGWSLGTSSNYSVLLSREPFRLLITSSGRDKGALTQGDFVIVDDEARPTAPGMPAPSAETWLHVACAKSAGAGAVLHTHSVWATLLSDLYFQEGRLPIEGYEMLKGLAGIKTHAHQAQIAIVENTQDIGTLAQSLSSRLEAQAPGLEHGFLLRRHGLYTWGRDLAEARRHVEVLEFLMEVLGRRLQITGALPGKETTWRT